MGISKHLSKSVNYCRKLLTTLTLKTFQKLTGPFGATTPVITTLGLTTLGKMIP
jgi:hypothetical protein